MPITPFLLLAQTFNPSQESFWEWVVRSAGPLIIPLPILTMMMLVGAVYVVLWDRRPFVIASCFSVLPLPLLLSLLFILVQIIKSLSVMAAVNTFSPTSQEIAQGVAELLVLVFLSLLWTMPAYLALMCGLIWRCRSWNGNPTHVP